MDLTALFQQVETGILADFQEAAFVGHAGDKGENREEILRQFLAERLPRRYGVIKGEIVTKGGKHSHSADIIIYDALNCAVLYANHTAVLPYESVYGIIEVKSTLTKSEFSDAAHKIKSFKSLAPLDLSVVKTREYVTVERPSRPFGIIVGYQVGENSLDSLYQNNTELARETTLGDYMVNLTAVLGQGLIHAEKIDFRQGEKYPLLDTDEFVELCIRLESLRARGTPDDGMMYRTVLERTGSRTIGRLYVYTLVMLEQMKLSHPDIGQYFDKTWLPTVHRES